VQDAWYDQNCTFITVDDGPFDMAMATPSPQATYQRVLRFGASLTACTSSVIIGVDTVSGNGGLKPPAVLGHRANADAVLACT